MKPKHPAARVTRLPTHKALERAHGRNCNVRQRNARSLALHNSSLVIAGKCATLFVRCLGRPRSFELSVNIHDIETAGANTIKARDRARALLPLPSIFNPRKVETRETYLAGGDTGRKRHLKKQLEGSEILAPEIMHAVMN